MLGATPARRGDDMLTYTVIPDVSTALADIASHCAALKYPRGAGVIIETPQELADLAAHVARIAFSANTVANAYNTLYDELTQTMIECGEFEMETS
jgi:hypothetical protein